MMLAACLYIYYIYVLNVWIIMMEAECLDIRDIDRMPGYLECRLHA